MATPICACVLRLVSSMTHLCVYVAMVALVGNLFLTLHVRVVDAATSSSASGTTIRHAAPLLESAIRTNVQECMRKMQQTNVGHEPETDWQTCSDECYTQYRTLNRTIDTKRNLTSMFTADPAFAAKASTRALPSSAAPPPSCLDLLSVFAHVCKSYEHSVQANNRRNPYVCCLRLMMHYIVITHS